MFFFLGFVSRFDIFFSLERVKEKMYKEEGKDTNACEDDEVCLVAKESQGKGGDCSSQDDLSVNNSALDPHILSFISWWNHVFFE